MEEFFLNDAQAEPKRLFAMTRLVLEKERMTREELIEMVQPSVIVSRFSSKDPISSGKNVYRVIINCDLIKVNEDKKLALQVSPEELATMQTFQILMQQKILGVTQAYKPNYMFNLFSAWYIVQNERVLYELLGTGYDVAFNTSLSSYIHLDADRVMNTTKFNSWRKWAEFLGLGWIMRLGGTREILCPDVTKRIQPVLSSIFSQGRHLKFAQFIEKLSNECPELDNGELFNYCWQICRSSEIRGNRLSLALSTALRTLAELNVIRLIYQGDGSDIWQLFPAVGSPHQQVTHIQWLEEE